MGRRWENIRDLLWYISRHSRAPFNKVRWMPSRHDKSTTFDPFDHKFLFDKLWNWAGISDGSQKVFIVLTEWWKEKLLKTASPASVNDIDYYIYNIISIISTIIFMYLLRTSDFWPIFEIWTSFKSFWKIEPLSFGIFHTLFSPALIFKTHWLTSLHSSSSVSWDCSGSSTHITSIPAFPERLPVIFRTHFIFLLIRYKAIHG